MPITHPTTIRNILVNVVCRGATVSQITSDNGLKLRIYASGGTVPSANATTGLGTLACEVGSIAFGAASSGSAATSTTFSATNVTGANGCDYFRLVASDGSTVLCQGSVTATGGGGDLTLSSVNIQNGSTVTLTSASYTAPN